MSRVAEAVPSRQRADNWRKVEDDAQLKRKLQRFDSIVVPHLDAAYNLARWLSGNDDKARNVAQQAGMRAYDHLDEFSGADAHTWLLGIVRNTYYRELQSGGACTQKRQSGEPAQAAPASLAAGTAAPHSGGHAIDRALAKLPVTFREIVVLRELEALSYAQIAEIVCMPIKAVVLQMSCAMELLQEQILRLDPPLQP